jgi:predicted nucleic acid-binding protein
VVLVDTSIWIRFLAGREPEASGLDRLLAAEQVVGHDFVEGELLIGGRGQARAELLSAYAQIDRLATIPHEEVVAFVAARNLAARGIGWVDAHLLASTLVGRCLLWTADASLADLAATLHTAYLPEP